MKSSVARMLYDSLRRGDPLDAEWFWEAGTASAQEGTPLDVVIWDAVREIVGQFEPEIPESAMGQIREPEVRRSG